MPIPKWLTLAVCVLVTACDGTSRSLAPSGASPAAPTYTLSGVVRTSTASGVLPVDAVRLRLEQGSFRREAVTDRDGFYVLSGLAPGSPSITLTKDAYVTETRTIAIEGDSHLDFRLTRGVFYTQSPWSTNFIASGGPSTARSSLTIDPFHITACELITDDHHLQDPIFFQKLCGAEPRIFK